MFYDFGVVVNAFLLVGGIWWCKEIFGRWRDDVDELRSGDRTRQVVTVTIWLLTVGVIILMVNFIWAIAARIINVF